MLLRLGGNFLQILRPIYMATTGIKTFSWVLNAPRTGIYQCIKSGAGALLELVMRARAAEYLRARSSSIRSAPASQPASPIWGALSTDKIALCRRRRRRLRRPKLRETFHGQILLCRPLQTATCVALGCLLSTLGTMRSLSRERRAVGSPHTNWSTKAANTNPRAAILFT